MSEKRKIRLEIPGDPIPWARPGQNRKRRFDDQKIQKQAVGLIAKSIMLAKGYKPLHGPVLARFEFLMPIPTYRAAEIMRRIEKGETVFHCVIPDDDNLVKFYGDALNKIAYRDDCQIAKIDAVKYYALRPKTVIEIGELKINRESKKAALA